MKVVKKWKKVQCSDTKFMTFFIEPFYHACDVIFLNSMNDVTINNRSFNFQDKKLLIYYANIIPLLCWNKFWLKWEISLIFHGGQIWAYIWIRYTALYPSLNTAMLAFKVKLIFHRIQSCAYKLSSWNHNKGNMTNRDFAQMLKILSNWLNIKSVLVGIKNKDSYLCGNGISA